MDKYSKNSLLGQLKQSGLISNNEEDSSTQGFLPFGVLTSTFETTSPFENFENIPLEPDTPQKAAKKRINELDGNFFSENGFINENEDEYKNSEKKTNQVIQKIAKKVHFKKKVKKFKRLIFKFCPLLHKSYIVKKALNRLIKLHENAKELMSVKIPYGESDSRYNDFTIYLNNANVIHAKLTKKI